MNKREEGKKYEELAREYLQEQGYRILMRNFRCKTAEIDLVAREGKYLVFVEVKERASSSFGLGCEAVDPRKQRRICAAARFYMRRFHVKEDTPVRFDVVSIDRGKIRLVRSAFLYRQGG